MTEEWRCAGCGKISADRLRVCECITGVVFNGQTFARKIEPPDEIEAALRAAFPHFQNDEPIAPEAIKRIGAEWEDMVINWVPFKTTITFSDQDGKTRNLEWYEGEPECGSFSGYVIPDDADWQVGPAGS